MEVRNKTRHQRVAVDVETILAACSADQKCPFSNLRFSENVFEFEFNKATTRIFYWINITDDYPDHCLLTTSNNVPGAEPVTEVVSDRLPVIFNKIAKAVYKDMKLVAIDCYAGRKSGCQSGLDRTVKKFNNWKMIRKGEADSDFTDSDASDEEENHFSCEEEDETVMCPKLETEIQLVRAKYGRDVIRISTYGAIDQCDIELMLYTTSLEDDVAKAWNLIPHEPLHILLHLSMSQFVSVPGIPIIEVFQRQNGANVKKSACYQVETILTKFVADNQLFTSEASRQDQDPHGAEGSVLSTMKTAVLYPMKYKKTPKYSAISDCKNVPSSANGVFVQILMYGEQRLGWLNDFCVICDEQHIFKCSMLKPTVCSRDLCVFSFQTLGVMSSAAEAISTDPEVVDLLVAMARSACKSPRRVEIMEPFPSVVDPDHPQRFALDPQEKNFPKLLAAMESILPTEQLLIQASTKVEFKKKCADVNPLSYRLLEWIISSNRSYIVKLPANLQLPFMRTRHQFLMRSSTPAKEAVFIEARSKFGSTFAFHGSHIENWHSIVRRGLVNATGTSLQMNGAVHGPGIYLSPSAATSFRYSGVQNTASVSRMRTAPSATTSTSRFLKGNSITCIALCEVITSNNLKKHLRNVWVMPDENFVATRFFFVYDDGSCGDWNTDTQDADVLRKIHESMSRAGSMQCTSVT